MPWSFDGDAASWARAVAPWTGARAPTTVERVEDDPILVDAATARRHGLPSAPFALALADSGARAAWHDGDLLVVSAERPPGPERLVIERHPGHRLDRLELEDIARQRASELWEARLAPHPPEIVAEPMDFAWVAMGDRQRDAVTIAWERGLHTTLTTLPCPSEGALLVSMTTPEACPMNNARIARLLSSFAFGDAPADRPGAQLERSDGGRFLLDPGHGSYAIGSSAGCEVVLSDEGVVARHARLRWTGSRWWLAPEGEAVALIGYGRVPPEGLPIHDGDVLAVGSCQLRVHEDAPTNEARTRGPLIAPPNAPRPAAAELMVEATLAPATSEVGPEARVCLDGENAFFVASSVPLEVAGDEAAYLGPFARLFVHLVHGPYDRKVLERHLAARMSLGRRPRALLALRLGRRLPGAVAQGVRVGRLRCASLSIPAPSLLAVLVPWPKRDVAALVEIGGSWMLSDERVVPLDAHVDAFLRSFRWDAR